MANTPSTSTGNSPNTPKQHILDLNETNGAEYGRFIKSIIDEYTPLNPERKLSGTRESKTLKDIEEKIKSYIGVKSIATEVIDDDLDEVSVAETVIEGNTKLAEKFFQVKLTYERHNLHILIQRSSLYLVGYKGYKLKEEEATGNKDDKMDIDDNAECKDDKKKIDDNAECWIILSGGDGDDKTTTAAVDYLKEFQTSYKAIEVKLGPSYQSLISAFDSDFNTKKRKVLVTNLYDKLTNRMKVLINRVEKTEYTIQIIETVKQMITARGENGEPEDFDGRRLERAELLINWLEKNIYSWKASEREDAEIEMAAEFKNFWDGRLPKLSKISDSIAMKKLMIMLEVKHKVLGQGDAETRESEFHQWLKDLNNEIRKAVKILHSIGYKITVTLKTGDKPKDILERKAEQIKKLKEEKKEADLKGELPQRIELIKLLKKEIPEKDESIRGLKEVLAGNLQEKCRLHEDGKIEELKMEIGELDKGIISLYSAVTVAKDLYQFCDDLNKISTTLGELLQYFGTSATYSVANEEIKKIYVNRQALIDAFKHLTQNPFDEKNPKDFAKHITQLVVMICEATRFSPIADHIKKCYTGTKLSDDEVALINMWSDLSGIIKRGWTYKGERESGLGKLVICVAVMKGHNSFEE